MEDFNRKNHWDNIYQTKSLQEVSWYQPVPETSLQIMADLNISIDASIIDIGGGDSFLVDELLQKGYTDVSVLDISEAALKRAQTRLGDQATKVEWICADASEFIPTKTYDYWHDRAAFHFLTQAHEIEQYLKTAHQALNLGGYLTVGTFSENGPLKCSGIPIQQYSEMQLSATFGKYFKKINCFTVDHPTPFDTIQNFIFGIFQKTK
ncbi:class I SAM-dependent methyltransferase [Flavobacterium sp. CYK-55]|uniref:class I SAM-dependent methyltransferase n=1 Tax=Flavobacterium sp. CYK-55 TaxID=2835529 RepID=UPI001BCD5794|nr:class I SAM-dependent methyltransferase [Flavobacterium sp. CYK-55]MBS7788175.1 class I SAM-dependent methyltransferase [Flavobacterium sp. CYK-55]